MMILKNYTLYRYERRRCYNKSNAIEKEVTIKGSTIEQYPPPIAYTPKNAAVDTKKAIQYMLLDFLVVSITNFFANIE